MRNIIIYVKNASSLLVPKSLILVLSLFLYSCVKQDIFNNPDPPEISSIFPEQGKAGSSLFIYGSNFSPNVSDNTVSIGTTPAEIYKADSSSLEVIIPEHLTSGYVSVGVRNKVVMGPLFTYLPTISVGTYAGSGLIGFEDGTFEIARFNTPRAITIDNTGNLYVADQGNNAIRKISPGGVVSTIAGDGTAGFKDGIGSSARFNQPAALTVSSEGILYVADFGNNAVRKITTDGTVTTLAGDTVSGFINAQGTVARFWGPAGIISAPSGGLLVSDFFNNVIRLVGTDGSVTTYAGTGSPGITNGNLTTCQFLARPHHKSPG